MSARSRLLGFHLTDRCQLDCQHCARDPGKKPTDVDLAVVEKILDEAKSAYNIGVIGLTGGEPTLHPRFLEVLDAIASRGLRWRMVTNGATLPKLVDQLLAKPERRRSLDLVAISVDGATEATHDRIRGAGSYRDVMSALSICTVYAIPFALKMTVHSRNVGEIEAMGASASHLGAREVVFAMLQPTGTLHDEDLFLTADEWRAARERIERLAATLRLPVALAEGFPGDSAFAVCGPIRGDELSVDVHGRLSMCCAHSSDLSAGRDDSIAGDLHEMSLVDAHRKLLGIGHGVQDAKLQAISAGAVGSWDMSTCNFCFKFFGKAHWTDHGAAGPSAKRERWRGAWAPEKQVARHSGSSDADADADAKVRLRVVR